MSTFVPDIKIEDLLFSVENGMISGENYVVFECTNNSNYKIVELKITFEEKAGISKDEMNAFYSAIQSSQGFDDEFMKKFRENLRSPMSMYVHIDEPVEAGKQTEKYKCYYYGGWGSKNVPYAHLFEPQKAIIKYEKDGTTYTLYYNFASNLYDLENS